MRVQGQTGCAGERTNYRKSDGDVRHEMAVHHVHVDDGRPAALGRLDLLAEPREICRKDGGRNLYHKNASGPASPGELPAGELGVFTYYYNPGVKSYSAAELSRPGR